VPLTRRQLLRCGLAASLTAAGGGLVGCGREDFDAGLGADALALHRESLVLDLHVDTFLWTRLLGYEPATGHRANPLPGAPLGGHVDAPRAARGGLDAAVMGLVINPDEVRDELMLPLRLLAWWEDGHGIAQTLHTLELMRAAAERQPERLAFVLSGSELRRAVASRPDALVMLAGLEGGHGLSGDPGNLARAYDAGLRMVGLVHFQATAFGLPMTVPRHDGRGLPEPGRQLLEEMDRLGVVADLAHLNAAGVDDALGVMTRPFVVSHTGCAAVHDHPRNLTDDQLRRIADAGGVVGIAVGRSFLGGDALDAFVLHVEHAVRVAGPGAVALGSDWDGFIVPVEGLGDVRGLPRATAALLERGMPEDTLRRFLGANAVRVLTEVCG